MTTDAQAALANMRKAIQGVIDPAVLLMTTNEANAILAHVEAQKAEIERLTAERDDLRRQLAEAEQDLDFAAIKSRLKRKEY